LRSAQVGGLVPRAKRARKVRQCKARKNFGLAEIRAFFAEPSSFMDPRVLTTELDKGVRKVASDQLSKESKRQRRAGNKDIHGAICRACKGAEPWVGALLRVPALPDNVRSLVTEFLLYKYKHK